MYNENIPTKAELPSKKQLIKSTLIAFAASVVILITIILPAEYAIDPTGIGRALGLQEMGEIKSQLAIEAEEDAKQTSARPDDQSPLLSGFLSLIGISSAQAQTPDTKTETVTFTLSPGEGTEYKLRMLKDAKVSYNWQVKEGRANYDLHGDNATESISYKKGRGVTGDQDELLAVFTGNHGWFWRNRMKNDITIRLTVKGDFIDLRKMK